MGTAATQDGVSVVLLSGFLGAGKTTLLKRILSWDTDMSGTVVMVNEFGNIGIDGMLLKSEGSEVVELASGCICCTLSIDFKKSIESTLKRFRPRRVFVEASGVADPDAIISVINDRDFTGRLRLEKVATVLDADYWEAREAFGPIFYRQLQAADLILLNKIDLVQRDKIAAFLTELHERFAGCQVVPTLHCGIDPEAFWSAASVRKPLLRPIKFYRVEEGSGADAAPHLASNHFTTFSFESEKRLDKAALERYLSMLPFEVFRVKGPVCFTEKTEMLNFVGGKAEWSDWPEEPATRLAFIAWGEIDPSHLLAGLDACATSAAERRR